MIYNSNRRWSFLSILTYRMVNPSHFSFFFLFKKKKIVAGYDDPGKLASHHTQNAQDEAPNYSDMVFLMCALLSIIRKWPFFFVSSFSFIFSSSVGYNYCRSTSRTNTRNKNNETLFYFFFFQRHSVAGPIKVKSRTPTLVCVHFFFEKKKNVEIKMSEMLWRTIHIRNRGGHYLWTYGRFNLSFMLADSDQTLNMGLHS